MSWVVRTLGVPAPPTARLAVGVGGVTTFLACDVVSTRLLGQGALDLTSAPVAPKAWIIATTMLIAALLPIVRGRPCGGT